MTQDFSLWKHQVRQAIRGLSTFEPPFGQGFRAALHALYIESHFVEFMAAQGWRQAGLGEEAGAVLLNLQTQLNDYDEPDTDVAVLADPRWWAILGVVLQAAALLGGDDCQVYRPRPHR
ncbi:hypothetical protein Q5H92_26550 [Hymenobacter sp. M29]|uniref:Uncharacterized protein n=1 Tax=Hymenobacter mellowenesis TaxID=3063995 RepID=A0ABT9AJX5_9BACT|nr:hypothetical protein [Hymenobacter sp. M29]MDO7849948.1 hypothetical protein [Hymenobacter sp. M29]